MRMLRTLAVVVLVAGLAAANLAALTLGTVFNALSEMVEAVAPDATVRARAHGDLKRLRTENGDLRTRVRTLDKARMDLDKERGRLARQVAALEGANEALETRLSASRGALATERGRVAALREEGTGLRRANADLRQERRRLERRVGRLKTEARGLEDAVRSKQMTFDRLAARHDTVLAEATERAGSLRKASARIGRRMATSAARNVASMPLEALPFVGWGVIASVTALEIADACATAAELAALAGEEAPAETTYCGLDAAALMKKLEGGDPQESCKVLRAQNAATLPAECSRGRPFASPGEYATGEAEIELPDRSAWDIGTSPRPDGPKPLPPSSGG